VKVQKGAENIKYLVFSTPFVKKQEIYFTCYFWRNLT